MEFHYTRIYKDRLFKAIFGRDDDESKKRLLSLYNALNNSNHTDIADLQITTIENIIYITMKNDLSFLIDSQLNLYEQQSSFNPNMPLRGLMYFAQLYQEFLTVNDRDLFTSSLVKIPTPKFIVFYNGSRDFADETKLRLSDAFEIPDTTKEFEWTATMINLNRGHSKALQKNCKPLYDYCIYVERIKENLKVMPRDSAIEEAVNFAVHENLLEGFFKRQRMEVMNMSLTEFDQEEYDRHRRAEGHAEGCRDARLETARNLLKMNLLSVEQIAQASSLSVEEIRDLQKEMQTVQV